VASNARDSLMTAPIGRSRGFSRSAVLDQRLSGLPSRPGEFHPEPLTDPDLILSHHPARAIEGCRLPLNEGLLPANPLVRRWSWRCRREPCSSRYHATKTLIDRGADEPQNCSVVADLSQVPPCSSGRPDLTDHTKPAQARLEKFLLRNWGVIDHDAAGIGWLVLVATS